MDAALSFLSQYARQLAIAALVAVSLWALKKAMFAIRNWREISDRLAQSKKAKAHEKLTRILIQAVSGIPVIVGQAIPIVVIGFAAVVVPLLLGMSLVDIYRSHAAARNDRKIAEGALELLRNDAKDGDPVSDEVQSFLEGYVRDKVPSEKLNESIEDSKAAETTFIVMFFIGLILLALSATNAWLAMGRWVPEQMTALPMSLWLDRYLTRLMTISTKDEARLLVGLEQNVCNEETLRQYLESLSLVANKYNFSVLELITFWLATSRERAGIANNARAADR